MRKREISVIALIIFRTHYKGTLRTCTRASTFSITRSLKIPENKQGNEPKTRIPHFHDNKINFTRSFTT